MKQTRRRAFLVVVIVLSVGLAGCSGAGTAGGDGGSGGGGGGGGAAVDYAEEERGGAPATRAVEMTATPAATGTPARDAAAGGGGRAGDGADAPVRLQQEALIKTGHVSIEVDSFDAARRNLSRAAEARGGFVSDSNEELHRLENKTWVTGRIVMRVPQENFTALMDRIKVEGTVLRASTDTRDVTDQLVDIRARLSNLRAQRDQLRDLYERANDTEDVLAVQRRLSNVQTEIERLEARQQSLRQRVAYSTITVELAEPRPEPEPHEIERWYDTGVVAAFLESVDGVVTTLRALVVGGAYLLPYLLAFGLPVGLVGFALWRRRTGSPVRPARSTSDDEDGAGDADDNGDEDR